MTKEWDTETIRQRFRKYGEDGKVLKECLKTIPEKHRKFAATAFLEGHINKIREKKNA